ncbi:MAG: antiporter [Alphaproteobacteria bacterium]|nr:antiporter [Alphaproteobacteria bacterium]
MAKDLTNWDPEDAGFWAKTGKAIAYRNLWISIPCLLCGFAVWIYWSVITVQMLNLGFPFTKGDLFTLNSIAGFAGATLRIPASFFVRIAGGRNTIFFTTALLLIPAYYTGIALQDINTPLWQFQLLALLCGFGGGNFAASMSNISFFFPKKMQGLSLGLNAGLGNFGVTMTQIIIPFVMTMGVFGGSSMLLKIDSGTLIGKIAAGSETWIHNAGFVWVVILVPFVLLSWFLMNNIKTENVTPHPGHPLAAFFKMSVMLAIGLAMAALGLWLILPASANGSDAHISKWIVMPVVISATVALLAMIPGLSQRIRTQYAIFKNAHTWIMTVIYTMTFGSFIGYSAALPLAMKVIFGFQHVAGPDGAMTHALANPNAPAVLQYAWIGPFIGALIRPVGGWISDKLGGALVTQVCSVAMVALALLAAHYMQEAYASATPEIYFQPFFLTFLGLFLATGIGNGSTFRTIAVVFDKKQAGPVLGWTSAIAAYGAFIIPIVFGEQIEQGFPEHALYGFAGFYLLCMVLNWWAYLSPGAQHKNP